MAATLKQTIANRLNALRATGPRTPEGKLASSMNAIKHGLSRVGLVPPAALADAIADRVDQWRDAYRPDGPAQQWLYERLCAESVRLDACERRILAGRAEHTQRAIEAWDDDRAAAVADLAAGLSRRPEVVQPRLLKTRHGVLWLLDRWEEVAALIGRHDGWTPGSWALAMDLLGLAGPAREESGPWELHPEDKSAARALELVRTSTEALRERLDAYLDARDARSRDGAEAGLFDEDPPEVRRFERYAADARRQVARCRAELTRLQGHQAPAPTPSPAADPPRPVASSGPPGPRPDRTDRSRPVAATPLPQAAPEPAAVASPEPTPRPSLISGPQVARSTGLAAMLRDRIPGAAPVAESRRARRAAARRAAARRS